MRIAGVPMMQVLVIDASIAYPKFRGEELTATFGNSIAFRDADFRDSLAIIAAAIEHFHAHPDARSTLPNLRNHSP